MAAQAEPPPKSDAASLVSLFLSLSGLPPSSSTAGRVFQVEPDGVYLSQIVLGTMVLWGVPSALMLPSLRSPLAIARRLGLAYLAALGALGLWTTDAVLFFGPAVLPLVPLSVLSLFHPKHQQWATWVRAHPAIIRFRGVLNALFLLLFVPLRLLWLPAVMVAQVIPDALALRTMPKGELPTTEDLHGWPFATVASAAAVGAIFASAQLSWAALLTTQACTRCRKERESRERKRAGFVQAAALV